MLRRIRARITAMVEESRRVAPAPSLSVPAAKPESRRRTWFSSEARAWLAVGIYTTCLYSTLTVAFRLYVTVYDRVGRSTVSRWMNGALLLAAALCAIWLIRVYRPRPVGYLALVIAAATLIYAMHVLQVPAKRFHYFEYIPLAVLLFDALRFRFKAPDLHLYTFAAVCLVGLGDESLQGLLPNRYFGVTDLVVNASAGALTLLILAFVVGEENYPLPEAAETEAPPGDSGRRAGRDGNSESNATNPSPGPLR
ncbi:MAG: hypothetical protein Kow00109_06580 [Acidobacteriota bacterium]